MLVRFTGAKLGGHGTVFWLVRTLDVDHYVGLVDAVFLLVTAGSIDLGYLLVAQRTAVS